MYSDSSASSIAAFYSSYYISSCKCNSNSIDESLTDDSACGGPVMLVCNTIEDCCCYKSFIDELTTFPECGSMVCEELLMFIGLSNS